MGRTTFDELLQALQASLISAQNNLRNRQVQGDGRQSEQADSDGLPAKTLVFAMPCIGKDKDVHEMFSLPLQSLQDHQHPQISMLSLEFDCELIEKRLVGAYKEPKVAIRIRNSSSASGKNRHRLFIAFYGTEAPCGEVLLDGEVFMAISPLEEWAVKEKAVQGKRSMVRAVAEWWHSRSRKQEFILTAEQTEWVREKIFSE